MMIMTRMMMMVMAMIMMMRMVLNDEDDDDDDDDNVQYDMHCTSRVAAAKSFYWHTLSSSDTHQDNKHSHHHQNLYMTAFRTFLYYNLYHKPHVSFQCHTDLDCK